MSMTTRTGDKRLLGLCRFSVPLLLKPLTQRGQRTAESDRASLDFALGAVNRLLDAIGSEVVREAA